MNVLIFSFFSGLGLLDCGFEKAGFDICFVNELSHAFMKCYQYAHKNITPRFGYQNCSIDDFLLDEKWSSTVSSIDSKDIIGFIGGPPCPDFSVAGKNGGAEGKNGRLTQSYINLIVRRSPDFFVFENVKGLYMTHKHRQFYDEMLIKLAASGYVLFDGIENALEYGAPQYRDRLFLIGFNKKRFGKDIPFYIGSHKKYRMESILALPWPHEAQFACDSDRGIPEGIIEELTVEYWFRKNRTDNHPNANDCFKIKNTEKYSSTPEGYTKGKSFKRLHRWRFSPTAAYGNNEVHLHPYKARRISISEALAIQSVPKEISLPDDIPLSLKFKMVSNGVPFLLAHGIALDVKDCLKKLIERSAEQ